MTGSVQRRTNVRSSLSKKILRSEAMNSNPGLINAKLSNINNLVLEWGEAAGPFLSIEPLMRYIAEIHKPMRDKVTELLKADRSTKNNKYIHYWDCNPKYLVDAIEAEFGADILPQVRTQIIKYPAMRDKFLHGNFTALLEVMGIEPSSRLQVIPGKWKRLEPGEIYESFLSMKRNEVFKNLRRYSSEIMQALNDIIRGLAS